MTKASGDLIAGLNRLPGARLHYASDPSQGRRIEISIRKNVSGRSVASYDWYVFKNEYEIDDRHDDERRDDYERMPT